MWLDLPSEIINDILLRLTAQTIAISKCVCKSWLDLLEKDEFVKSHLSRSAPALALFMPAWRKNSSRCTLLELEDDEIDVVSSHDHRYNRLTKFNFPGMVTFEGSVNGLIFLSNSEYFESNDDLYVWNPISREYIELHCPQGFFNPKEGKEVTYGFGATKISGQHKVVRITPHSEIHVYTLGTGSWRHVEAPRASFYYGYRFCFGYRNPSAFVNGNLHWLVFDSDDTLWISCFDLETECFSTFSVPRGIERIMKVSALNDCLCLCDDTFETDGIIVIWLMKEYGVEKSWTKEYVIELNPDFDTWALEEYVTPINVFKDGDILIEWGQRLLSYYSNKTKTTQKIGVFNKGQEIGVIDEGYIYIYPVLFTPSFRSLKSFEMENVKSLKFL